MLKRLKRWLGWDSDSGLLDFADFDVAAARQLASAETAGRRRSPSRPPSKAPRRPQRRAKTERSPADVLDNPRLTLDKPADDGFDPYNTGAFNRSTSWEQDRPAAQALAVLTRAARRDTPPRPPASRTAPATRRDATRAA